MTNNTVPMIPMRPANITGEAGMSRVTVLARIENLADVWAASPRELPPENMRSIEFHNASVDTGCSLVGLPPRSIQELGLGPRHARPIGRTAGAGETTVSGTFRLTIQDRFCSSDVFRVPDDVPVLIGQIRLE